MSFPNIQRKFGLTQKFRKVLESESPFRVGCHLLPDRSWSRFYRVYSISVARRLAKENAEYLAKVRARKAKTKLSQVKS